jgi:hypothetical protein
LCCSNQRLNRRENGSTELDADGIVLTAAQTNKLDAADEVRRKSQHLVDESPEL